MKKTLLVIDDSPFNIDIIVELLPEYDIVTSLSAEEAFKILELEKINLILLDIIMPNMDGYEMCKILKKNIKTVNIPIIFLSSNNKIKDIQKGFELGAVDYVTKPFNKYELKSRIDTHLELSEYHENLEEKIRVEKRKSQDKDEMIFYQNKLASMGEMIRNIAHQWRQPLSQINSHILIMDLALNDENNKVDKEIITQHMQEIEYLTQYMSNTIDDFQNFFLKEKQKKNFIVNEAIESTLEILKGILSHHQIKVALKIDKKISIYSHKNEIQQVILIILNNAKDILVLENINNPQINIELNTNNKSVILSISDNAGGIQEKNIYKIFEPYYTTKHKKQGTGLGLYISKMIIEESLHGEIKVENKEYGACFNIILPKG